MSGEYGRDLSGVDDMSAEFHETEDPTTIVAQAIGRRWITPRGQVIDDPEYGYDLFQHINEETSQAEIALMVANLRAEALKDERVLSIDVSVAITGFPIATVTVTANGLLAAGPFHLVLDVSQTSVQLLTEKVE